VVMLVAATAERLTNAGRATPVAANRYLVTIGRSGSSWLVSSIDPVGQ
jgi:hypothetical protein